MKKNQVGKPESAEAAGAKKSSAKAVKKPLYVTPAKAANWLGVHPVTIARWVDAGKLKAFRTLGGHRRIPISEIERLRGGAGLNEKEPF